MRKKLPKSINLIETINAPGDTFTIFYEWTFTIGKYLLIFVQIVVIAVFVVRLTADRINNDLTRDINNQVELLLQADIRENESKYRNFQTLFEDLDLLEQTHVQNSRKIVSVLDSMPSNINLVNFSFNNDRVSSNFTATSLDDIKKYEIFLEQSPEYTDLRPSLEMLDENNYELSVNYIIVSVDE
jgi:hypothetical protein